MYTPLFGLGLVLPLNILTEIIVVVNTLKVGYNITMNEGYPTDTAGFYCEVYAIFDKRLAESVNDEIPGANARMFVVRDFNNGRSGPFFLVDEDGAICIDIFEDGIITASDDD